MSIGDNKIYNLPKPLLLNCLKHHAGYVAGFIRNFDSPLSSVGAKLACIGKSQMDLYIGSLSTPDIFREITCYLKRKRLLEEAAYIHWINSSSSLYRKTLLSDGAVWIFLPGKVAGRYVHIHPGRYSPFTMRVRSETLKTAIAVLCYSKRYDKDHTDPEVINEARTKLLDLSPVRSVNAQKGTGKLIRILSHINPA